MHHVIIIGAGPVGLSAAICLANFGIKSILIEKHPTITNHPKARGVNCRTMELFRSWGLEEKMKYHQMPQEAHRFTWLDDLQGNEITRVQATVDLSLHSPTQRALISQDSVEEELYNKVKEIPLIDIRFNTKMLNMSQNDNAVSIEIINLENNQNETLSASYLIAADGANSSLRSLLNIEMEGQDNLGTFCNIYCKMNLDKYVKYRPSISFIFTRPDVRGTFLLSKKDQEKWLIGVRLQPDANQTKETFTDKFCIEYIKKVINDPEIEVELINKGFWTMAALIAKQYRVGRVFLAGDAAHRLPPTGGFGMNTGIQDAHNLAWKLAMVIKNEAHDSLLDTYFTERVKIAQANMQFSIHNAKRFEKIFIALEQGNLTTFKEALEDQSHHLNNIQLDLGFIYDDKCDYSHQENYVSSSHVGARAPHCWIMNNKNEKSTLDLFSTQFMLLCHPDAYSWQEKYRYFPCQIITIGEKGDYLDKNHDFLEKYHISKQGAVLIRPDGHVAWKSEDEKGEIANFSWLNPIKNLTEVKR